MDINAFISSGILENYCLGFCSAEEIVVIEQYAQTYPSVKTEIEKIRISLEDYFFANQLQPSPAVKQRLMLSVYEQSAKADTVYAPLIKDVMDTSILASWITAKKISGPVEEFENLFITDLPSTNQVTNFIVHAKKGHDAEMHDDFVEYLYLIEGSCTMNFEGKPRSYKKGDIIQILPYISHTAIVTSLQPMVALVQRQACA